MSAFCQAKSLTERFVVELEQNSGSPNKSFSIKRGCHTLTQDPPVIANTNGDAGPDLPPDNKRHKYKSYGIKTTLIKSISWQWLHAAHLLVGYELIPVTKDVRLSSTPYLWLPIEVVVVSWLLKSYWNPTSPLFNHSQHQEAASVLTQDGQPFAIITMMHGSGDNRPQCTPLESSGQRVGIASCHPAGSFNHLLYSDSDGGDGGPRENSHTLGFNCFVHPCHGVCQFPGARSGQSSRSHSLNEHGLTCIGYFGPVNAIHPMSPASASNNGPDGAVKDDVPTHRNVPVSADDLVIIDGLLRLSNPGLPEGSGISCTAPRFSYPIGISPLGRLPSCNVTVFGEDGLQRPCGKVFKNVRSMSSHKSKYHTGQKTCDLIVAGKDGQQQPCGEVFMNAHTLANHKRSVHSGQKTCNATLFTEDNQPRPCGTIFKNAQSLSTHKSQYHTGQKTCEVTVIGEKGLRRSCGKLCKTASALLVHKRNEHIGEKICGMTVLGGDGQPHPCRKVCKKPQELADHKRRDHSRQQTCEETDIGEDGLQRPCRKIFKNTKSLTEHKSRYHRGPQTCGATVVGEDDQPRPCGTVCKHGKALSDHKIQVHSGQKSCKVTMVGKDGQPRPCGKICKNAHALANHKSRQHREPRTCEMITVGVDGQQQSCGKIFKNVHSLSDHKRRHRKRQRVDENQDDDRAPEEGKVKSE